jgi:hypothetical protein
MAGECAPTLSAIVGEVHFRIEHSRQLRLVAQHLRQDAVITRYRSILLSATAKTTMHNSQIAIREARMAMNSVVRSLGKAAKA